MSDLFKEFSDLPIYEIELGVQTEKSSRKKKEKGLNNAEILFINENGSPVRHIPPRPVIEYAIEDADATMLDAALDKAINKYIDSGFKKSEYEKELKRFAIRLQDYTRDLIYNYDKRLAPNSPFTISKKKVDHPLFDTGQLARSITAVLKESGK